MSLTRNFLKSMGLTDEQVSGIIEAHTDTVDALKAERDKYKTEAEKLPEVQKELKTAQDAAKKSGDAAAIQKAFDDYKAEVQAEKTKAAKETALRKMGKDAGLTEKGIEKAVRCSDWYSIEFDKNGKPTNAKDVIKSLKEDWPEHLNKTETHGAETPNPNAGGNGGNDGKGNPRAAEVYKQYHAALYGDPQGASNEQKGANNL